MKTAIITTITNVFDLIAIIAKARNNKGQFATIEAETNVEVNQFPNEEYCNAKGITLASGKGSKAINEPYRHNGSKATKRFKVEFHYDESYDNKLKSYGLTRSENGSNRKTDHFGSIAIGYESTTNVLLCYMPNWYIGKSEYYLDGHKANEDEVAYINGYKKKSYNGNTPFDYRTVGVKNVRSLSFGGNTYIVKIDTITPADYDALKALYCSKPETEVA
jgi:hypothetical protein